MDDSFEAAYMRGVFVVCFDCQTEICFRQQDKTLFRTFFVLIRYVNLDDPAMLKVSRDFTYD